MTIAIFGTVPSLLPEQVSIINHKVRGIIQDEMKFDITTFRLFVRDSPSHSDQIGCKIGDTLHFKDILRKTTTFESDVRDKCTHVIVIHRNIINAAYSELCRYLQTSHHFTICLNIETWETINFPPNIDTCLKIDTCS